MKKFHLYLILISILMFGKHTLASESLAVVIASEAQTTISLEQISHVFLGRSISAEDGRIFKPLVYDHRNAMQKHFSRTVLKRSARQLKSFWVKQLFTGKGEVPKTVRNVEEMKSLLGKYNNYIGYLPLSEVDDDLKIVYIVNGSGGT